MELDQRPEPSAGQANKSCPQANFEQLFFFFVSVAKICSNVLITVFFSQDLLTLLMEASEIQRKPWELYERWWMERLGSLTVEGLDSDSFRG